MKKFANEKFQKALFNTYVRVVDTLTAHNFLEESEIFSAYEYEVIKLDSMLQAQENETNILIRRNSQTKNSVGKLFYF